MTKVEVLDQNYIINPKTRQKGIFSSVKVTIKKQYFPPDGVHKNLFATCQGKLEICAHFQYVG